MNSSTSIIGARLTFDQRDNIDPGFTGINIIPNELVLYVIIPQLKEKDFSHMAQVCHRFNGLIEQYRKRLYVKEDFETLINKVICGTADIVSIRWLARRHPERKCSPEIFDWVSEYGHTEIVKLLLEANSPYWDCYSSGTPDGFRK